VGEVGLAETEGVWLSLPCVIDRSGVAQVLPALVDPSERERLLRSAGILQAAYEAVSVSLPATKS